MKKQLFIKNENNLTKAQYDHIKSAIKNYITTKEIKEHYVFSKKYLPL